MRFKNIIILFISIIFGIHSFSQRYLSPIFTSVTPIMDIQYGSATNYKGQVENLMLDLYQPTGDIHAKRPLIIYIHGGGFTDTNQTRKLAHIVAYADSMARRGYVVASIDYRLDTSISNRAVIQAMHDSKAAVRFLKANASLYKLDTSLFFIGGESAGAITSLTTNYNNTLTEVAHPSTTPISPDASIEGNSGNPGYSSTTKATMCLCGGTQTVFNEPMFDTNAMQTGDAPILIVHGTADNFIPVIKSLEVATRATNKNIPTLFYSFRGATHCPWFFPLPNSVQYLDSLIDYTIPFLYACIQQTTGIESDNISTTIKTYPNPSDGYIELIANSITDGNHLTNLYDANGKIIWSKKVTFINKKANIDLSNVSKGIYLFKIEDIYSKNTKIIIE